MTFTIRTLLLLVAVILFLIEAFADVDGVSLLALGLAAFAGAFIVPDRPLDRR